jgi:hypothetical protein
MIISNTSLFNLSLEFSAISESSELSNPRDLYVLSNLTDTCRLFNRVRPH